MNWFRHAPAAETKAEAERLRAQRTELEEREANEEEIREHKARIKELNKPPILKTIKEGLRDFREYVQQNKTRNEVHTMEKKGIFENAKLKPISDNVEGPNLNGNVTGYPVKPVEKKFSPLNFRED